MNVSLPQLIRQNPFASVEWPEKMIWTASSIKLFRRCKRKWFWKYIMRLRTRQVDKNLLVGSAFHNTLGQWYRGLRSDINTIAKSQVKTMQQSVDAMSSYYDQDDLDKMQVAVDTFLGMMKAYGDIYDDDRQRWKIERKSIEYEFTVDMGDFIWAGKMDLVYSKPKEMILVEHKSASKIDSSYVNRLPLDTQIRGYVFGGQKGELKLPINKVLYDVIKKCKLRRKSNETVDQFAGRICDDYLSQPDKYFYREELKFSKGDIDCFEHEVRQTHKEYMYLRKQLGNLINPRDWTPNDMTCNDFFRECEYMSLCVKGLDKGTALSFEQGDSLHEELSVED